MSTFNITHDSANVSNNSVHEASSPSYVVVWCGCTPVGAVPVLLIIPVSSSSNATRKGWVYL